MSSFAYTLDSVILLNLIFSTIPLISINHMHEVLLDYFQIRLGMILGLHALAKTLDLIVDTYYLG